MMFYVIGAVFLVGGVFLWIKNRQSERDGIRVPAVVVGREWVEERTAEGRSGGYFPVVEYTTIDGSIARNRTRTGGLLASQRVGKRVHVIYDPHRPRSVVIDSPSGRGSTAGILCVVAGIVLIVQHVLT